MEREEEINNASHQLYNDYAYRSLIDIFKFGAQWADTNRPEGWIDVTYMMPEDIIIDSETWIYTERVLVLTSAGDIDIADRYWDDKSSTWRWNISPNIGDRIVCWKRLPSPNI